MSNDDNFGSNNPYQTNAPTDTAIPVIADKPTSMVVFGILNLVWGAIGLCGMIFGLVAQMANVQPDDNNPLQDILNNPSYQNVGLVMQGFGVVLTLVLLVSGIGLLNGQAYGRTLANVYGGCGILLAIASLIVNFIFIAMPMFGQAEETADPAMKTGMIITGASVLTGGFCAFIYPVLLLIFVNRAPVINYLKSHGRL